MRDFTRITLAACLIGLAAAPDAFAQPPFGGPGRDGPGHGPGRGHGPDHGPARVLVPDGWHGGHWRHDWYDGRFGWWWVVGGARYFYPAPIYPYPDPTTPPGVAVAPSPQYAYYCGNPAGYYPAVAQCLMPWQLVSLAAPVAAAPVVAAPAPAA